ncbi:MAG: DUF86 domain-containing protein [Patescibacteria group bacterium]|nr:DUF86 domain-containing protein [Patescibacteria group bacterium]
MAQDNNKDDKAYLLLMLDAIAKIKGFTADMSFEDFSKDGKTQSAVIMQLQVIGELAKKVPEEIKTAINIPWKNMAGFRDMISHNYFGLDIMSVWHTVEDSVPKTEIELQKYINARK